MNDHEIRIQVARLDERINALSRQIAIDKEVSERALKVAAEELARRLDTLNHAHIQAVEVQATYLPRELFAAYGRDSEARYYEVMRDIRAQFEKHDSRLRELEGNARTLAGKLWLPMILIAGMAATLAGILVQFIARKS